MFFQLQLQFAFELATFGETASNRFSKSGIGPLSLSQEKQTDKPGLDQTLGNRIPLTLAISISDQHSVASCTCLSLIESRQKLFSKIEN